VLTNSKTDNRILWLTKILLGLCLLTPLLASDSFLFPYTSPKGFAFRILMEIAAVFWFYLALKYPEFRPKKTALNWAVLVFLAVWILSALTGVDFNLSFWGNLERMFGIWGLIHFVLFFFILQAIFKTRGDREFLLKISLGASSFISLLAIGQKFMDLGDLMPMTGRVFGTLGNPAFLATYLIFNIFFAGYLALSSRNRTSLIYYFLLVVNCFALFLTGTRGAFLGLLAGIAVLLASFGFFHPQKNVRRYSVVVLILFLILFGSIFAFRNSALVQKSEILQRLTSISLEDTTAQNRLILWQKAWLAWQEKPILGFGAENYEVAANKYFDPRLNPYEAWYDKAHNFIFDYGVTLGWLGLLSYLSLFFSALSCLWKARSRNSFLLMTFGSLFLAYLVQNFFVFDTFAAYLMLFFILAMISGAPEEEKENSSPPRKINFSPFKKSLWVILAIFVVFSIYSLNFKPLLAGYRANQILSSPVLDAKQTTRLLKEALDLKTFASPEIIYQITMDHLSKIEDNPQLAADRDFFELSSVELLKTVQDHPQQARYYVALAWLNLYFYDQPDKNKLALVADWGRKIKILAPAKKEAYLILTAVHFLANEKSQAEQVIEEAYGIDKDLGDRVKAYWESLNR